MISVIKIHKRNFIDWGGELRKQTWTWVRMSQTWKRSSGMKCFHVKGKDQQSSEVIPHSCYVPRAVNYAAGAKDLYLEPKEIVGEGEIKVWKVLGGQVKDLHWMCFARRSLGRFEIKDDSKSWWFQEICSTSRVQDLEWRRRSKADSSPCGSSERSGGWCPSRNGK